MPDVLQPVVREAFSTQDFERAREVLAAAFGDHVPTLHGDSGRFRVETSTVEAELLRLDDLSYGPLIESRYEPLEHSLMIGIVRSGSVVADDGEHERRSARGDLTWFRPGRVQHVWVDDVRLRFARLDMAALGRVAHELSGIAPDELRFHPGAPVSTSRERYWDTTRRWVAEQVLADDALVGEALLRAEAFRALAHATLLAVPNTALDLLADPTTPPEGSGEPATVRRAVEFMDAHAGEDIDITRIATEARIGPRALQAAFRQYRGQTPLEYLRRVRMDGAHRDLRGADPTRGDTVAAISGRWGFGNPGRFAVEYARLHGCSPSDTLRR